MVEDGLWFAQYVERTVHMLQIGCDVIMVPDLILISSGHHERRRRQVSPHLGHLAKCFRSLGLVVLAVFDFVEVGLAEVLHHCLKAELLRCRHRVGARAVFGELTEPQKCQRKVGEVECGRLPFVPAPLAWMQIAVELGITFSARPNHCGVVLGVLRCPPAHVRLGFNFLVVHVALAGKNVDIGVCLDRHLISPFFRRSGRAR